MKKIAVMVLAGVLAAVPVSTTGAAEFQDGADTQNFIWAAGEETSTDIDESKGVSANDSVVEGLDKPLVFYPNTYYKINVTGAGTQNTNPVESDGHHYTGVFLSSRRKAIFTGNGKSVLQRVFIQRWNVHTIYISFSREKNIQEVYGRKTILYNL